MFPLPSPDYDTHCLAERNWQQMDSAERGSEHIWVLLLPLAIMITDIQLCLCYRRVWGGRGLWFNIHLLHTDLGVLENSSTAHLVVCVCIQPGWVGPGWPSLWGLFWGPPTSIFMTFLHCRCPRFCEWWGLSFCKRGQHGRVLAVILAWSHPSGWFAVLFAPPDLHHLRLPVCYNAVNLCSEHSPRIIR